MLEPRNPFPSAPSAAVHLWGADLNGIDRLLADDEFIDVLWQSFHRSHPKARKTGR